MSAPDPEEIASFRWGGVRARPRKKIKGKTLTGATYLKPPGSLGSRWPGLGISIEIECCDDCQIYILDKTEQVQVADCKNCRVVVGPCVGSVFFMDCVGCTFSVAAKQIRVRDVTSSELRIYAPTHECAVVEVRGRIRAFPLLIPPFPLCPPTSAHRKAPPFSRNRPAARAQPSCPSPQRLSRPPAADELRALLPGLGRGLCRPGRPVLDDGLGRGGQSLGPRVRLFTGRARRAAHLHPAPGRSTAFDAVERAQREPRRPERGLGGRALRA